MSPKATALVLALLAAGTAGALAQSGAPADPAQAAREKECGAKADENAMQGTLRETFMTECIAGEKVSEPKAGDKT
ncbi:hypothetical protein U8607_18355 [Methylobacterium durans]|uniref:Phosphate starvation-inducible protein PsiF n=1 Tax=Methylobacterium durans TaxID=2202825 RepID=A0A2U8W6N2_9HYPH|nr:hypothetical protein [Methylobacterium durans]AWN41190.1 hypothetical protein DK389_12475 [Methylobacterium durans]MEA1834055.1 hypothetical protein [Methylobacterium durans]